MHGFDEKLRDDFAGRAMASMLVGPIERTDHIQAVMEVVAEVAYMMADAMMAERAKREEK